ncbi:hypothetical protein H7D67_11740 [Enterococcus faecalis]|uniref:hypothetical protein n=1 Tax=Enterococcus faecalis TaxID=1351 RepID=UPI000DBB9E03|nr:hypothetical protein [Enterococcus faecalis]MBB6709451.1 hypothetical protein [Enterococcus faecalis]MCU2263654.1 hypothetical protein [Enterococcus faecalis]BBD24018.1 hypothetical protein KUB3006_C04440 [Enterococcus faecalis]BBD27060.1 hypothetical protein KUB3007_C04430 [Enterococcus faecalis]
MNIQKALIELTINGVVTCKHLADFYDAYHEDKEFSDAINFLNGSIHVDMAQIKEELRNSEDKGSLGVLEYIQKHYLSAMLFMNLLPQEKRRFIH